MSEMITGIIPAGGQASRFGGHYKELLPCGPDETLLQRTARQMVEVGAEKLILLTSVDKYDMQLNHLRDSGHKERLCGVTDYGEGLGEAIKRSLHACEGKVIFAMPDTYTDAPEVVPDGVPMSVGLFTTHEASRFGRVDLKEKWITDKPIGLDGTPQLAWGTLSWNVEITHAWMANDKAMDFTDLLNEFMPWADFYDLSCYYDMGSWDHYVQFIQQQILAKANVKEDVNA